MLIDSEINAFNAGLWDPDLSPRTDLDKYRKSCLVLDNYIPKKKGGAKRRRGFEDMGEAKYQDRDFGVKEYKFGDNVPFMLEMGDQYIRFYSNGIRIIEDEVDITNIADTSVKATVTLTVDTFPTLGDTMTIAGRTYTVVLNGQGDTDGEIEIGLNLAAFQTNIIAALDGTDGWNTEHPLVEPNGVFVADNLVIDAKEYGPETNLYESTETFTAPTNVFSAATFTGYIEELRVDCAGHTFVNGDVIQINDLIESGDSGQSPPTPRGMTELNKNIYTIYGVVASTSFLIAPYNAGSFSPYWYGGSVGKVYEISTIYDEQDINKLEFRTVFDIIWIIHTEGKYPVYQLKRFGNTNWTFTKVDWVFPPTLDLNTTSTTLTSAAITGTGIALTASADLFDDDHVGSRWVIEHPRSDSVQIGNGVSGAQATVSVRGDWTLTTSDLSSSERLDLERSYDGGSTWQKYITSNSNERITGNEPERVDLRVNVLTGTASYTFNIKDYVTKGVFEITGVTDAQNATIDITTDLGATTATADWYEAAFSDFRGHPSGIEFYGEGLYLGRDMEVWRSVVGDFTNFERTGLDDGGFYSPLPSKSRGTLKWIADRGSLLFGTTEGVFVARRPDDRSAITPSNFRADREISYGVGDLPPILTDQVLLFTQKDNRILRELSSTEFEGSFNAIELTELASEVTGRNGLVDMVYQETPEDMVWGIRKDIDNKQKLVAMAYNRNQNVVAWSEHATSGKPLSIEKTKSALGDELWMAVKRDTKDRGSRYHIERMRMDNDTSSSFRKAVATETETVTVKNLQICWNVSLAASMTTELATLKTDISGVIDDIEATYPGTVEHALYTFGDSDKVILKTDFTDRTTFEALIAGLAVSATTTLIDGFLAIGRAANDLSWNDSKNWGRQIINYTDTFGLGFELSSARAIARCQPKSIQFCYGFISSSTYLNIAATLAGETGADYGRFSVTSEILGCINNPRSNNSFDIISRDVDYLDSSKLYTSAEHTPIVVGLEHLEGETVYANADGITLGPFTVTKGRITLGSEDNFYSHVWVGRHYDSDLQPANLEYLLSSGSTQGDYKGITHIEIELKDSAGIKAGTSTSDLSKLINEPDNYNQALELINDKKNFEMPQGIDKEAKVYVRCYQPQPAHILGIYPQVKVFK